MFELFQIMAFLLRKKTSLLNHRTFQLILSIAGTAELGFGSSVVTNVGVFRHILCNFEVNWRLVISPEGVGVCDGLELPLTQQFSFLNSHEGHEKENLKGFGSQRPSFIIRSFYQWAVWPWASLLISLTWEPSSLPHRLVWGSNQIVSGTGS